MTQWTTTREMKKPRRLTRRQLLLGLGGAGVVAAWTCAGGFALRSTLSPEPEALIRIVTSTPDGRIDRAKPPIVAREDWGARAPDHAARTESGYYSALNPTGWMIYEGELTAAYQTAVIHHSVIVESTEIETLRAIQDLHQNDQGWADVAYHFFVGRSGAIYAGRDWHARGTHVGGYNTGSLGICLLGNFMQQNLTTSQRSSTQALVNWATDRLALTHLAGHRNFNDDTVCPGDNLARYLPQLAAEAGLSIGTEGYIPPSERAQSACPHCAGLA